MVAMDLVRGCDPAQPDADLTRALVQGAGRRGLILLSCGVYAHVIRCRAPLTIREGERAQRLEFLEASRDTLRRGWRRGAMSQARPAFESVGAWKYSDSSASSWIRRRSSAMRPAAVLIGRQS